MHGRRNDWASEAKSLTSALACGVLLLLSPLAAEAACTGPCVSVDSVTNSPGGGGRIVTKIFEADLIEFDNESKNLTPRGRVALRKVVAIMKTTYGGGAGSFKTFEFTVQADIGLPEDKAVEQIAKRSQLLSIECGQYFAPARYRVSGTW